MTSSSNIRRLDDDTICASQPDDRTIETPLACFSRLLEAPSDRGEKVGGLHWEALNKDISVANLLVDQSDVTRKGNHEVA